MLIMIEGLDRTGKTTLAEALGERLDAPVIHLTPPKPGVRWYEELIAPLAGYGHGVDLILDRWHWSELIWPDVFGRTSILTPTTHAYIDRVLARLGAIAVLGTGDVDTIWEQCLADDEVCARVPNAREKFDLAAARYDLVAAQSAMPAFAYDWRAQHLTHAVDAILAMARDAEHEAFEVRVA